MKKIEIGFLLLSISVLAMLLIPQNAFSQIDDLGPRLEQQAQASLLAYTLFTVIGIAVTFGFVIFVIKIIKKRRIDSGRKTGEK